MTEIYKPLDFSPLFNYKTITRIHGIKDYHSIKTIEDEVKANASSVQSSLGGGLYCHLGLVLSDTKHARISVTPYNSQRDLKSLTFQQEQHNVKFIDYATTIM
jgi:hypothetical protein